VGGGRQRREIDSLEIPISERSEDLLKLDEALVRLAQEDAEAAEIVKLRYFGGLTLEQAAQVKGVSRRTAGRYWSYARLWLYREVTRDDQQGG
jgi:DNA-directed RNA polymerase specialized sigma24 family protein